MRKLLSLLFEKERVNPKHTDPKYKNRPYCWTPLTDKPCDGDVDELIKKLDLKNIKPTNYR
ncbi:MAG: hypothetical protein HWD86_01405 [Kangiellaceae bacterium]|nr:hypothetical protein [Kangiellaceae bacterium]